MQSNFAASVMGMCGSGWVWLVTDGKLRLAVLPTFAAGTLLVRSKNMMNIDAEHPIYARTNQLDAGPQSGSMANFARQTTTTPTSGSPQSHLDHGMSSTISPTSGIRISPSLSHTSDPTSQKRSMTAGIYPGQVDTVQDDSGTQGATRESFSQLGGKLYPLFCISVHEHAWMSAGYGVWGKGEYVKRFWNALDWNKVSNADERFHENRPTTTV